MSEREPLASCLMPTCDRRPFIPRAVRQFLDQDYPHRELVVVDDGRDRVDDLLLADPRIRYVRLDRRLALGAKRNLAAETAAGAILVHWDDDDWMASWRLSYQVRELTGSGADACGLARLYFHDPLAHRAWEYVYSASRPWVAGGTLCYARSFWEGHRFAEMGEGEDNDFLWRHRPRLHQHSDAGFYIATVHRGNTSRKATSDVSWRPLSPRDLPAGESASALPGEELPRISCLMPTGGRPAFARQAIRYFRRQTYPNKEMVIVDDGDDGLEGEIRAGDPIRYVRLSQKLTLGAKLNLATSESEGRILANWDDDDWYAPERLTAQAAALLRGGADLCCPAPELIYDSVRDRFWHCSAQLRARLFYQGFILGGALMYLRRAWDEGVRHPDITMLEDVRFVELLTGAGKRLQKIPHPEIFVYMRHQRNTWRFQCGKERGPSGWRMVSRPAFFPEEDHAFYRRIAPVDPQPEEPLASPPQALQLRGRPIVRAPGVTRRPAVLRRIRL